MWGGEGWVIIVKVGKVVVVVVALLVHVLLCVCVCGGGGRRVRGVSFFLVRLLVCSFCRVFVAVISRSKGGYLV